MNFLCNLTEHEFTHIIGCEDKTVKQSNERKNIYRMSHIFFLVKVIPVFQSDSSESLFLLGIPCLSAKQDSRQKLYLSAIIFVYLIM